jgi:tetratricopeptide (TPR) repeat protein
MVDAYNHAVAADLKKARIGSRERKGLPDLGGIAFAVLFLPFVYIWTADFTTKSQPLGPVYAMCVMLFASATLGLSAVLGALSVLGFGRRQGRSSRLLGGLSMVLGAFFCFELPQLLEIARYGRAGEAIKRGEDLAKSGRFSDSVAAYSEALKANPKNARAYLARAGALNAIRNPTAALADCDSAQRNGSTPSDVNAVRGVAVNLLNLLGHYREAVTEADRALLANPADPSLFLAKAEGLLNLRRFDQATQAADRAVEAGKSAKAYSVRGAIANAQGDLDRALADMGEAIRRDPGQMEYLNARGLLFLRIKAFDQARKDFDDAIRVAPGVLLSDNVRLPYMAQSASKPASSARGRGGFVYN